MPPEKTCWRLWAFGTIQGAHNSVSGEWLLVYGSPEAVLTGGPFRLTMCDGRPLLIGLEGDDDSRALGWVDELSDWNWTEKVQDGKDSGYELRSNKCGDKPVALVSFHREPFEFCVMDITESGCGGQFEFVKYLMPTELDGNPVSVWVSFRWIID